MAVTTMQRAALCIHLLDENKIGKSPAEAKILHLPGQTSLSLFLQTCVFSWTHLKISNTGCSTTNSGI